LSVQTALREAGFSPQWSSSPTRANHARKKD
jgi:hypothetical protein